MNITLTQKRFLIIWCTFHLFALIVNVIPIKGRLPTEPYTIKDEFGYITHYENYKYLFTDDSENKEFWPFVTFSNQRQFYPNYADGKTVTTYFHGIFNSYDITEFFFYIFLGFAVIFLPKIWKENEQKTTF